jgi:hypothetical protein
MQKNSEIFEPEKTKNIGMYLGVAENKKDKEFSLKTVYDIKSGDS